MSRIHQETIECLKDLQSAGEKMTGKFSFPASFAGFQGHFENNPVLPGVCKIQAVLVMHEISVGERFRLKEVSQAKYFAPVTAEEEIIIHCESKADENGTYSVKVSIEKAGVKAAQLLMRIQHEN